MDGSTDGAWRRLNAALFKLEQFLSSIDSIAASDFPHADSEIALHQIRKHFEAKRSSIRSIPRGKDTAVDDLQEWLRDVRDEVRDYTKWLGIILRSTNIRNSFEIYYPLKRLAQKAVSKDTRLIFSSEWEFTPFTYPMNVAALPDFIIVGAPATESQNLLVVPLAGHEIGHSVWKNIKARPALKNDFEEKCRGFVDKNRSRFPSQRFEKKEVFIIPIITAHLLDKAEEVFCDLVGLQMFGESYFYAFEYFMAPGINKSTPKYPPSLQRIRALVAYAERRKITIPKDLLSSWNQDVEPVTGGPMPYEYADEILDDCLSTLIELCETTLDTREVITPNEKVIDAIDAAFRRGEPYGSKAKLSETINALWRIAREADASKPKGRSTIYFGIEVALKTIEVSEYFSRLEE